MINSVLLLAAACPILVGNYSCPYNGSYTELVIKQNTHSVNPERVKYNFDYVQIPGEPDIFTASTMGDADGFGWINRCVNRRIVSVTNDGSAKAEWFLDQNKNLIRTLNDQVSFVCYRHSKKF